MILKKHIKVSAKYLRKIIYITSSPLNGINVVRGLKILSYLAYAIIVTKQYFGLLALGNTTKLFRSILTGLL